VIISLFSSPFFTANTMPKSKEPKDPKDKWWNEWPLEGPENRPAVWITKVLSKSPLLIGWDDERIERRAMEALSEAMGEEVTDLSDLPEFHFGPKKEELDNFTFGLLDIVSKEITKKFLNLEVAQEGEDKKKTLEEVGGQVFVEETTEPGTIRDTELYKLALGNLQWQRDNYLVGKDYADQRKSQRNLDQDVPVEQTALDGGLYPYKIPFNATALGNIQLTGLGSWFIPSKAVHNSLLPLVVALPSGLLHIPILRATADLIPLSQGNVDLAVKNQLLWIFDNQQWRDVIKSSTKGYITNTYVDASTTKQQ
jgi:hypothetical protein